MPLIVFILINNVIFRYFEDENFLIDAIDILIKLISGVFFIITVIFYHKTRMNPDLQQYNDTPQYTNRIEAYVALIFHHSRHN